MSARFFSPTICMCAAVLVLVHGPLTALLMATEPASVIPEVDDSVLRAALGRCKGDPGFDQRADLNGDGCVNVLDLALLNSANARELAPGDVEPAAETVHQNRRTVKSGPIEISVDPNPLAIAAGACRAAWFKISINATLLGYSLDIDIDPDASSTGTVTADVASTNFFLPQNIIENAPRDVELHPLFSLILDPGDGGVFVNTLTDDGCPVTASEDVNDVFTEVFFNASADALGSFDIQLGPASALSDGNGQPIPYNFTAATIIISCAIDFNGDGEVSAADLAILLGSWGFCVSECCPADLDGNGDVEAFDLALLLGNWGPCP